ncbi:MAG: hypothetical protein IPK82_34540 [Polyangiaceae bacterium]|nr:hypothetical protein [Polyangiaceae bacterium]
MSAYDDIPDIKHLAKCVNIRIGTWRREAPEPAWNHLLELAASQGKLRDLLRYVLADSNTLAFHERIRLCLSPEVL